MQVRQDSRQHAQLPDQKGQDQQHQHGKPQKNRRYADPRRQAPGQPQPAAQPTDHGFRPHCQHGSQQEGKAQGQQKFPAQPEEKAGQQHR